MTKRFTAQHAKNGYAAMGNNPKRPRYKAVVSPNAVAQKTKKK